MTQPISQTGMWARGMIYTLIPFLTVLSSDAEFRQSGRVNPGLIVAAVVAGLIGLRAFLDQSGTNGSKPVKVEVEQPASKPVPTAEMASGVSVGIDRTKPPLDWESRQVGTPAFMDLDGDGLPDSEGDGPQDDEAPPVDGYGSGYEGDAATELARRGAAV